MCFYQLCNQQDTNDIDSIILNRLQCSLSGTSTLWPRQDRPM